MSEADEKRIIEAAKKFEEYRSNVGGWHRHLIADYIATRKAECEYWQSKLKEVTLKLDSVQDNNHGLRILMKEMAKHLKELANDLGGCDHSVGICQCDLNDVIRIYEELGPIDIVSNQLKERDELLAEMAEYLVYGAKRKELLTRYENLKAK